MHLDIGDPPKPEWWHWDPTMDWMPPGAPRRVDPTTGQDLGAGPSLGQDPNDPYHCPIVEYKSKSTTTESRWRWADDFSGNLLSIVTLGTTGWAVYEERDKVVVSRWTENVCKPGQHVEDFPDEVSYSSWVERARYFQARGGNKPGQGQGAPGFTPFDGTILDVTIKLPGGKEVKKDQLPQQQPLVPPSSTPEYEESPERPVKPQDIEYLVYGYDSSLDDQIYLTKFPGAKSPVAAIQEGVGIYVTPDMLNKAGRYQGKWDQRYGSWKEGVVKRVSFEPFHDSDNTATVSYGVWRIIISEYAE